MCENFAEPIITGFLGQPCVDPYLCEFSNLPAKPLLIGLGQSIVRIT